MSVMALTIVGLRKELDIADVFAIVDASWRAYPGTALALCGLVLLAKGLWLGFTGSKGLLNERDALGWMRGFRLAVVGLCLFGIAVAWIGHLLWLFVVSLGVLGEELLETSVIIEVLKRAPPARARGTHRAAVRGRVPATIPSGSA